MGNIIRIESHPSFVGKGHMRFELPDGTIISGSSYDDIVERMANEKLTTVKSKHSYRRAVSKRIAESSNIKVRYGSSTVFVNDLVIIGQLKRIGGSKRNAQRR